MGLQGTQSLCPDWTLGAVSSVKWHGPRFNIKMSFYLRVARNIWPNYEGRRPEFTNQKCLWWVWVPRTNLHIARKFMGTCTTLLFHRPAIWAPVKRENHTTWSKKPEQLISFFMIHHNIYWFQAMMIPAALNIKKGDFIVTCTFYCPYSVCNSIL